MLSGDIANHVCLEEEQLVLEIVHSVKEYLIKRLFVNQAKVNYQKWTLKNKYSDEELKQIGKTVVNLIETTELLPTIIEEEDFSYSVNKIVRFVLDYANWHEGSENNSRCLIVLDLGAMNQHFRKLRNKDKNKIIKIIKYMKKISSKLNCTIIFTNRMMIRNIVIKLNCKILKIMTLSKGT